MESANVGLRRLEEVLLNATAPSEQLLYDGWLLRLSQEHIKRASSVNPVSASQLPVAEKVDHCERVYRERGLTPIFRITSLGLAAGLDGELEARGYRVFEPSLVQVVALDKPAAPPASGTRLEETAIETWVAMVGALRGWAPADIQAHTKRMAGSALESRCLRLLQGEEVAACGVVTLEGQYAGLFDIYTAPEFRSKGLATELCRHLLRIGQEKGATIGWLSVLATNEPALAVYRRLGFETAYRYWYRVPQDF
jgi:ribosomal protein S18 acetylase RimI-like enzyme